MGDESLMVDACRNDLGADSEIESAPIELLSSLDRISRGREDMIGCGIFGFHGRSLGNIKVYFQLGK